METDGGEPIRVAWLPGAHQRDVATALERSHDALEVVELSPADLLASITAGDVDVVVSGQDLESRSGLDVLATVREENERVPFVLYPYERNGELAEKAISAGVTDYIPAGAGGVSPDTLAERIVSTVCQRGARTAGREARYRQMLNTVGDVVYTLTPEGEITAVNDAATEITGYDRDELEGAHVTLVIDDEDVAAGEELIQRLLTGEIERGTVEMDIVTEDGEHIPCENHVSLLRSSDGEFVGTVGVMRDITERRRRERALEALHDATREMMTAETPAAVATLASRTASEVLSLPLNAVFIHDSDREMLVPAAVSPAAQEVLDLPEGFERGRGIAWTVFENGEPRVFDDVSDVPDAYNPDTPVRSEFVLPLGEHGVLVVGSTAPDDFDETDVALGKVLAANVEAALTAAEREQTLRAREVELQRQNERLEEFASVVSHDLRSPLNVAQGRLELYAETGDPEQYEKVEAAHERMVEIIEEVLALAREGRTVSEPQRVDLSTVAADAWESVTTNDAVLASEDLPVIQADPSRVQQLLENLFRNALEHVGEDVTVRVGPLEDGFFVADDGPGIPESEREQVFESGYSTTESGTGFGLAIVSQIVDAHGWSITVTESETGGARFEITGVTVD